MGKRSRNRLRGAVATGALALALLAALTGGPAVAQSPSATVEPLVCTATGCRMSAVYSLAAGSTAELAFAFAVANWDIAGRTDSAFVARRELAPALDRYPVDDRDARRLARSGPLIVAIAVRWRPGRYRVDLLRLLQDNAAARSTAAMILDAETDDMRARTKRPVADWMGDGDFNPSDVAWADYLNAYLVAACAVELPVVDDDW